MLETIHRYEVGGFNTLEWLGFTCLLILLLAFGFLILKRMLKVSVSLEIHPNDGSPPPAATPKGSEKIMVMDDDAMMRESLKQLLSVLGYQVVCVESGEQAVAYMQNNGADLVMLDLVMDNGIDGIETYRRIRAFRPLQKAIILSGFADPKKTSTLRNLGVESYLVKPVSLPLLANAIRTELDRP